MKVALVNLAKIEDLSKTKYQDDIKRFLNENEIDSLDFYSNRSTEKELIEGFHSALKSDADLIWFAQAGNKTIRFLDKIDWELFSNSNKKFMGTSDLTYIAWKCSEFGLDFFYGPSAKKIYEYYPEVKDREFLVEFLKNYTLPTYSVEKLSSISDYQLNFEQESVVGGHSFISAFMMQITNSTLKNKVFFLEHHYISGETFDDLLYFIDQIKLILNTKSGLPKAILLGNSYLSDRDGKRIFYKETNNIIFESLKELHVEVFSVDHTQTIIPFRGPKI